MKIAHLLMLVAFLAVSCSVALADGVDPTLLTSGCGKAGQPPCDAYLITSPNETLSITLTLDTNVGDILYGDAIASFINFSGAPLTNSFTVDFTVPAGLSFEGCAQTSEVVNLLFTCSGGGSPDSPITGGGTAVFNLTGVSLCSANFDDLAGGENGVTYVSDGNADDNCQAAFTLALQPLPGEILPSSISGTFISTAPEPASAVLLLFGLAAGLLALKALRINLA